MNVQVQMAVQEERPSCFGQLWNPNETECNGGPDPKYTHPQNGSHIRERCDFFNECGAKVQAQKLISPTQMVRPVVTPPPTSQASTFREYMQKKQAADEQAERARVAAAIAQQQQRPAPMPIPYYPQPQPQHPNPWHQPPAVSHPQPYYQQMMPVNYAMPSYLSVPEMRMPGQSFMGLLGREAIRAMGKSVGHTVANFFDMNPFRLPPPPGGDQR